MPCLSSRFSVLVWFWAKRDVQLDLCDLFVPYVPQRRPGLQAHIGAGEPPPSRQRLPRWRSEAELCVSWIHLPQAEVLGQECGGRAKRHHHAGAAQVRTKQKLCSHVCFFKFETFFFSFRHSEAYTWTNPTCCVHNIIVGQLWIEQYGNVEVINHRSDSDPLWKCVKCYKMLPVFYYTLISHNITTKSRSIILFLETRSSWHFLGVCFDSCFPTENFRLQVKDFLLKSSCRNTGMFSETPWKSVWGVYPASKLQ